MRDLNNQVLTISRRDNNEKFTVSIKNSEQAIIKTLDDIQSSLFQQSLEFKVQNTHSVSNYEDFKKIITNGGFIKCGWDGTKETEANIKKETNATIRCIPLNQKINNLKCVYSKKSAKYEVVFAKAY